MAIELKNTVMNDEINKIRQEIPALACLHDDALFNLVCFKYFYNDGSLEKSDYKNIFTDGKNDGGIDFITTYEPDNQQTKLVFAQCKFWENSLGKRDYAPLCSKMDTTIRAYKNNRKCNDYNDNLTRIMLNNLDEAKDEGFNEELAIFIYSDIDEKLEKEIKAEIEKAQDQSENLQDYNIYIYTKAIIDKQIELVNEGRISVARDKIRLYKHNGDLSKQIEYGDKGIFTSISAKDLKRLYGKYKYDGLFEQNLRYFRANKKIDDEIIKTIRKNKSDFWYFNNGIIIACSDFDPDGDNIQLWDFSVINGGQTTTLIGEYFEGDEDFAVPCKIIKGDDNEEFLAKVAEASNSQKAISPVDLKANAPEQIKLKKMLENEQIYLEIKRGKVGKKGRFDLHKPQNYNKNWDRISNEELGQLILSFEFQEPGNARSNKKGIFANDATYSKIFKNKSLNDPKLIKSLIKLYNYIKEYEKNDNKNQYGADTDENAILRYGKLFILAVVGFFLKVEKGLIDFSVLNTNDDGEWEKELQKNMITGDIFADYKEDDFEDILYSLFQEIISIIKDAHQSPDEINSTYTNFLKTNPKYRKYIIRRIIDNILKNKIKQKRFKEDYLKIFNL